MLMPDMSWQSSGYRYGFGSHENDNDIKGEGNHSSFGDYGYDPRVGRRLMMEPEIEIYPTLSPYVTYADNPINYKDPDGRVIIFINGIHEGNGGTKSYWGGYDDKVANKIGDYSARYVDGALGGWKNTYNTMASENKLGNDINLKGVFKIFTSSNVNTEVRINAGRQQGLKDAENVYNSMDIENGETVKIVSHSMGVAFARGYVEGLIEWGNKNNKQFTIEYELDVNAFDGENLPANPIVKLTQNKTGGLDGVSVFDFIGSLSGYKGRLKVIQALQLNSVPSVAPIPGVKDISTEEDKLKGHAIKPMSYDLIPTLGNGPQNPDKVNPPIQQGSNNENAPKK